MDPSYGGHPFGHQGGGPPQQQFPPIHGHPPFLQGGGGGPFLGPPPPPPPLPFFSQSMPYAYVPSPAAAMQQQQQMGPLPYMQPQPQPQQPLPPPPSAAFFNPWDLPPPRTPPPSDFELQKRIDKLVEYASKNGPEFERMLKEKQKDNPAYAFLFGGDGHNYYRYKLWLSVSPQMNTFNPGLPPSPLNPVMPPMNLSPGPPLSLNPALPQLNSNLNNHSMGGVMNPPPPPLGNMPGSVSGPSYPGYYSQQHHQQNSSQSQPQAYFEAGGREKFDDGNAKPFKGLSGPLPSDVEAELQGVLDNLTGTKESIKGAKLWFTQRSLWAPALAEALRDRVLALSDAERQLHVIYLANDILFDGLLRRSNVMELDNEALAFQPVVGHMLAAIYHNPQNQEVNRSHLEKILQFWAAKEVYTKDIISRLEGEMVAGPPLGLSYPPVPAASATIATTTAATTPSRETIPTLITSVSSGVSVPGAVPAGRTMSFESSSSRWDPELPRVSSLAEYAKPLEGQTLPTDRYAPSVTQPAPPLATAFPSLAPFLSSLPSSMPPSAQTIKDPSPPPPYPLFPPGLIPGMVRKMQIGSGVPYTPLSPLDIPSVIPPSTLSDSYVLERVAKFFKEIGEVDPLEGERQAAPQQSTASYHISEEAEEEEEERRRRVGGGGGACIPPPLSLQQVDMETNTLPDGSFEHKPGSSSSGRLGLGADLNEVSQYGDVYNSYRKQQSSQYHTSMSARSSTR